METRARYALIGLFTVAVVLAGFAFVYWIQNAGGLGQRSAYRVRFDGSVSGLLVGSNVLFNGMRVGEVIALELDKKQPQHRDGNSRSRRCHTHSNQLFRRNGLSRFDRRSGRRFERR